MADGHLKTLHARADDLAHEIRRLQADHDRMSTALGVVVGQCVALVKQQEVA